MKILKEQWAGLGMSMDLGLVRGDAEMAAAVWRNLLGARGARGIGFSQEGDGSGYRRAVNLVGGLVEDVSKVDVDKEELKDDNSGVHDFAPSESDRCVFYCFLAPRATMSYLAPYSSDSPLWRITHLLFVIPR
jgi:cytochrome b pre-mRNA-processing protein 3